MLAIVIFAISVSICKIATFDLPKWSQFESLTLKICQSYNIMEYVIGCPFYGLQDGEIKADLSQAVFFWSSNVTYTHGRTNR